MKSTIQGEVFSFINAIASLHQARKVFTASNTRKRCNHDLAVAEAVRVL